MTDEQLREAVAKVIARAVYKNVPAQTPSHQIDNEQWSALADAAIALMRPVIRAQALEEAAKVAEESVVQECCGNVDGDYGSPLECCGKPNVTPMYPDEIAAAIRALKENTNAEDDTVYSWGIGNRSIKELL